MSATNTVFYPRATNVAMVSTTVSSTAVSPTVTTANFEGLVFFDVQGADVMCTLDGVTTPTASIGHRLASGTNYTWYAGTFRKAKFIRQGAVDATIFSQELSC